MNTKVISIACAVVAFFAGAIWLSEANAAIVGTLVAFLEVAAGFGCGFWFKNADANLAVKTAQDETLYYQNEVRNLREAYKKLTSEKASIAEATKKVAKTKKSKES